MALTIDDLVYPNGELQGSMFPDGDVDTVAVIWLAEAVAKTADTVAQKHWVYYRAYTAIANRIASMPTSQSTNQGSHSVSWGSDRVTAFRQAASDNVSEYSRLTGDDILSSKRPASLVVY